VNNELSNDTISNTPPLWQRLSASTAKLIVRLWPGETKDWGRAFQAELTEIESPWQSFRWLLGGVMLLARERFKSFFRSFGRPVGIPAGGNLELLVKQSSQVPRTPRIITALFLLTSAAILLHPEVRTALRGIVRAYINPDEETSRWSSVHQLRKEAESTHDPKLFALLSLLSSDDAERLRLADQAIALDPSFTWVDYENVRSNSSLSLLDAKRLARLESWDPENAAVLLLSTEKVFESSISKALYYKGVDASLVKAPHAAEWLDGMNRAFAARRYDNYLARIDHLLRDVSATHPRLDPDIAAFVLPRERIPNLWNIQVFGKWLVLQGKEAEQRGDLTEASNNYWTAVRFGVLLRQANTFTIERLIGASVGKEAILRLQSLLEKTQPRQAEILAYPLAEWSRIDPSPWRDLWASFEWSGLSVQLAATSIFVFAIFSVFSLFVSILARRASSENRGTLPTLASWTIDACPPLLLLSSAALYFLYHPFAQIYSRYLHIPSSPPAREQLESALFVSHLPWLRESFMSADFTFRFWFATTTILVFVVIALLGRMFLRRQPTKSAQIP
jgi:hypothetical protein